MSDKARGFPSEQKLTQSASEIIRGVDSARKGLLSLKALPYDKYLDEQDAREATTIEKENRAKILSSESLEELHTLIAGNTVFPEKVKRSAPFIHELLLSTKSAPYSLLNFTREYGLRDHVLYLAAKEGFPFTDPRQIDPTKKAEDSDDLKRYAHRIERARSLTDLKQVIALAASIPLTVYDLPQETTTYPNSRVLNDLNDVINKRAGLPVITSANGLRKKVRELCMVEKIEIYDVDGNTLFNRIKTEETFDDLYKDLGKLGCFPTSTGDVTTADELIQRIDVYRDARKEDKPQILRSISNKYDLQTTVQRLAEKENTPQYRLLSKLGLNKRRR